MEKFIDIIIGVLNEMVDVIYELFLELEVE